MAKQYKFLDEGKKHCHILGGEALYGTSTVVGILNKPLAFWAAGMALEGFGWKNPKKHTPQEVADFAKEGWMKMRELDFPEYADILQKYYRAHDTKKKDSAEAGTDMHSVLEEYVKICLEKNGEPIIPMGVTGEMPVMKFANWAIHNVDHFLFSEGHTYSETYWLGGITDAGAKMKSGKTAILDFKSSKEAYYSQFVQIAGYCIQITERGILDKDGNQILPPFNADEMIVVPFGSEKLQPHAVENVAGFEKAFIGVLDNFILQKAFDK